MSVQCWFDKNDAEMAGVNFKENYKTFIDHQNWVGAEDDCLHGWCPCKQITKQVGWILTTPNGESAIAYGIDEPKFFDCKYINQEVMEYFLEHVKGSRLSF